MHTLGDVYVDIIKCGISGFIFVTNNVLRMSNNTQPKE